MLPSHFLIYYLSDIIIFFKLNQINLTTKANMSLLRSAPRLDYRACGGYILCDILIDFKYKSRERRTYMCDANCGKLATKVSHFRRITPYGNLVSAGCDYCDRCFKTYIDDVIPAILHAWQQLRRNLIDDIVKYIFRFICK